MKLNFSKVLLMGIVNATPDSFSGDGLFEARNLGQDGSPIWGSPKMAQNRLFATLDQYDIIDIGGESTNPVAKPISIDQELSRILPVINIVRRRRKRTGQVIAVDTYKPEVAKAAIDQGVEMLNILSGSGPLEPLYQLAAQSKTYLVIYHGFDHWTNILKVRRRRAQEKHDVVEELKTFFEEELKTILKSGVNRDQIIIDPGIGFGKTDAENLEIIDRLAELKELGLPILIGLSRKGFLGRLLQMEQGLAAPPEPTQRLKKALELTERAVRNGASIIRTHDVVETRQFLKRKGLL